VLRELGRETRGPAVVAASDGAIQNLDAHRGSLADAQDAAQILSVSARQTGLSLLVSRP
jgi:hypothetical protein